MILNTTHPIICAPMNQVSDVNLAIAVSRAGAMPSLSLFNYFKNDKFDKDFFKEELIRFKEETGSTDLILSVGGKFILYDSMIAPFLELGFKHIEMFHWLSKVEGWAEIIRKCKILEDKGVHFIFKTSTGHLSNDITYKNILVKGPDGAGRVIEDAMPLDDGLDFCRSKLPNSNLIACGGIYSAAQVSKYISDGAEAVAIGSLFAMSKESSISTDVKLKILNSTLADLKTSGPLNHRGIFSSILDNDDMNLTKSLKEGIVDPTKGVVFVGKGIEYINEILTVEQIVNSLV